MSERPVGCLLSGGLDSTLTAAIVKRYYGNINTYSIGLKGSVDLQFAKIDTCLRNLKTMSSKRFIVSTFASTFCLERCRSWEVRQILWSLKIQQIESLRPKLASIQPRPSPPKLARGPYLLHPFTLPWPRLDSLLPARGTQRSASRSRPPPRHPPRRSRRPGDPWSRRLSHPRHCTWAVNNGWKGW